MATVSFHDPNLHQHHFGNNNNNNSKSNQNNAMRQYEYHDQELDVDDLLNGPLAMPSSHGGNNNNNNNNSSDIRTNKNFSAILASSSNSNTNNNANLADPNRAQNVALKVQLAASERELAQCRHALDLALVKAGNWNGMKHRVTLAKPLNGAPIKQWASAPTASSSNNNSANNEANRSAFVIASLQSQLREKDTQLANANSKMQQLSEQVQGLKKQLSSASTSSSSGQNNNNNRLQGLPSDSMQLMNHQFQHTADELLLGTEEARAAKTAQLLNQLHFLLNETDRLEKALAEQRERDSANAVQRGMQTARELQQRDAKIAQLSNQLSSLKSKLTPLQKAAIKNTKEGEVSPMDLLSRIGQLEQDLTGALAARTDALNDKYSLQARCRKLEERVRDAKTTVSDTQSSAVEEVMQSAQVIARLRDTLATVSRERDNLQAALDIRRLREASKRLSSVECQTYQPDLCNSEMQTDRTEPVKAEAFCQVDSTAGGAELSLFPAGTASRVRSSTVPQHQSASTSGARTTFPNISTATSSPSSSSNSSAGGIPNDALSIAHSLELKCAELDNVRALLEEQALKLERTEVALKQTREALNAEVEVRRSLDAESEKIKAQIRTLQQTVSQQHVIMRDRDAALGQADERAQLALADTVKLAQERKSWERQLSANAHDFEQLIAQQATANQQVAQASAENEALREEVQKLLQREAQLSHALRAKDGELAEILSSYQMCVQEKDAADQQLRSIMAESNNLKGAIAMREERIAELQRELGVLHQREENLMTDIQACDYENGLLHRKVVQAETNLQHMEGGIADLEQQLQAQRRVTTQFEHAQAELHKQLIRKDNEVIFLKKRCEVVEHENTMLQTAHSVDTRKIRELDEANARLTVSGLMNQLSNNNNNASNVSSSYYGGGGGNQQNSNFTMADNQARDAAKIRESLDELAQRNGSLAKQVEVKEGSIAQLQQQLSEERHNVELLRAALSEKAVQLEDASRNREKLQFLLQEQANNLARHAQHAASEDTE